MNLKKGSTVIQHTFHALGHFQEARTFQGIEDVFSPPFINDDPGVFQYGKVPRQCGHVNIEHFENMADTQFPIGEFLNDL